MAQLIQMRQRIKAVGTIKKITNAMRLISMSTHSRLRHKKLAFEKYKNAFSELHNKIENINQPNNVISENKQTEGQSVELLILISSQKGLCGVFNTMLFKFFDIEFPVIDNKHIITVGKFAHNHIKQRNKQIYANYENLNSNNFTTIASGITSLILTDPIFSSVKVISNYPKSFFAQIPQISQIMPYKNNQIKDKIKIEQPDEYLFEQSIEELNKSVKQALLSITLQNLLFESLLAEQAARFLSMDNSTRNAEDLLNEMKLQYNKTRQASITRELTELAASF